MFYIAKQMTDEVKRGKMTGFRLYESEEARLVELVAEIRKRNKYVDKSKVLRQAIGFEPRTDITDDDLIYLRTGQRDAQINNVTRINRKRDAIEISEELNMDIEIVTRVLAGDLEGIDPDKIKIVQEAAYEETADRVLHINGRIANGR